MPMAMMITGCGCLCRMLLFIGHKRAHIHGHNPLGQSWPVIGLSFGGFKFLTLEKRN
jgi:hypothetical protein